MEKYKNLFHTKETLKEMEQYYLANVIDALKNKDKTDKINKMLNCNHNFNYIGTMTYECKDCEMLFWNFGFGRTYWYYNENNQNETIFSDVNIKK